MDHSILSRHLLGNGYPHCVPAMVREEAHPGYHLNNWPDVLECCVERPEPDPIWAGVSLASNGPLSSV